MATISTLTYEGPVPPPLTSCGMDRGVQQPILLGRSETKYDSDEVSMVDTRFAECVQSDTPTFWKQRILFRILASPHVISASFDPFDRSKCQMLFIQKRDVYKNICGFYAPYLSIAGRREVGSMETFPNICKLPDCQSVTQLFNGLSQEMILEAVPLLSYFINDPNTRFLGLTLKEPSSDQLISIGWSKV